MKLIFADLVQAEAEHGDVLATKLQHKLNQVIDTHAEDFVQDLSHLSMAARYAGNMQVDQVLYLQGDCYRCDYHYDWSIAWTCSGTQDESGQVSEKVRFNFDLTTAEANFKFLKFD